MPLLSKMMKVSLLISRYNSLAWHCLVLKVHFTSSNFSGSELSGKILVNINITGGIPNKDVKFTIDLFSNTATG